jgi:hypothetical protein
MMILRLVFLRISRPLFINDQQRGRVGKILIMLQIDNGMRWLGYCSGCVDRKARQNLSIIRLMFLAGRPAESSVSSSGSWRVLNQMFVTETGPSIICCHRAWRARRHGGQQLQRFDTLTLSARHEDTLMTSGVENSHINTRVRVA